MDTLLVTALTGVNLLTGEGLNSNSTQGEILAIREISLENRHPVPSVSDIFQDNILLNIAYLQGKPIHPQKIDWEEIRRPFVYEFRLNPHQTFAFHEDVLAEYKYSLAKTTYAHFNAQEGFKFSGLLYGDGVCHLASIIYWTAKDAGLDAKAPVSHDFANIPEVPKEYGVSIYSMPGNPARNAQQNLYITNNKSKTIAFKFEYANEKLKVSAVEVNDL